MILMAVGVEERLNGYYDTFLKHRFVGRDHKYSWKKHAEGHMYTVCYFLHAWKSLLLTSVETPVTVCCEAAKCTIVKLIILVEIFE